MTRASGRRARRSILIAASTLIAATTVATAAVPGFTLHDYIRRAIAPQPHVAAHVPSPGQSSTPTAPSARGIAFVPATRTRIVFWAEQTSGTLRIRVTGGSSIRITQIGTDGEARFMLTLDGASVHNSGSTASYELLIPTSIADAEILVSDRRVYVRTGMHSSCGGTRDGEQGCVIPMHRPASSSGSAETAPPRH